MANPLIMKKTNQPTKKIFIIALLLILFVLVFIMYIFRNNPFYIILITLGVYYGIFIYGIFKFSGVLNPKRIKKSDFFIIQFSIFSSFLVFMIIVDTVNPNTIKPLIDNSKSYFEMGSFSFIITAAILALSSSKIEGEAKKVGVLTLISTLLLFFSGIMMAISEIFSASYPAYLYLENSLSFLAIFNLVTSVYRFLNFLLNKWHIFNK
jgi:hypothetical protein